MDFLIRILRLVKRNKIRISIGLLIILGLAVRIIFVPIGVQISGDFQLFIDWGKKFWGVGAQNFYTYKTWTLSPPNYPPIASLIFGATYWLYDHRYVLAQLHNLIRIPPAAFIIYFYKYGYFLLLKFPSILSDLGIAYLIYKVILKIDGSIKKAYIGFFLFFLNPVTIFLSSIWGQTDSFVALFGMLSFLLILDKKFEVSLLTFFISLYTKPNWIYLAPFYTYVFIKMNPKPVRIFLGTLGVSLIYLLSTIPFSKGNLIDFTIWLVKDRLLVSAVGAQNISSSAFNFYTIFFNLYKHSALTPILGISASLFGWLIFTLLNIFVFVFFKIQKNKLFATMTGIYIIGFGTYLFMTNMLERYFFTAFAAMIVVMIVYPKLIFWTLILNLNVFLNIFWAFFRRKYDEIDFPFTSFNFLLIRFISLATFLSWAKTIIGMAALRASLKRD